ncbi:MAG: indolepyruvate oxidoreductase subunit beta [Gemmatimonadetes bacterium]|nr:indolepyruvate oxidoreductase subunit beta [Gemmatimonadota bacterium]NIU74766.1 indolepyruvate oxidoreductase subunit beta [Gammaproteobacteria bacterium]NIX45109.1 indolepyruvate oxidoreductase subunit beta [Gemmatimonadota bacterium]
MMTQSQTYTAQGRPDQSRRPDVNRKITSIVLAGVGGQGSVLATRVVATAAELAGHDVVTSEVHGMAQRGGTVTTTVRYGDEVLSSAIPDGEADFLVAFERLEAARHLAMVAPGGAALVNDQRIAPSIEALRTAGYPADLDARARDRGVTLLSYPALRLARELGNEKLASTVMLGALANFLFIDRRHWREAIRNTVPSRTVGANEAAFDTGAEWLVGAPSFSF